MLTRIAHLYFVADLSQAEIAKKLGLSRQTVGRAIKRSKELGVVRIHLDSPFLFCAELGHEIETLFSLKEAVVCRTADVLQESIARVTLGMAAGSVLQRYLVDGQVVGVSWGETVLRSVLALPRLTVRDLTIVQLDGSTNSTPYPTNAEYIVHKLVGLTEGTGVTLPAPLIVDSAEIKSRFVSDSHVAKALNLGRQAQLVLIGIGEISPKSNLYRTGYLNDNLIRLLRDAGAVGDICGQFYDIQGQLCVTELSCRTISIDLEDIRSKAVSIGVAGGRRKATAIMGALNGKLCNVLVTDEAAARELIRQRKEVMSSESADPS